MSALPGVDKPVSSLCSEAVSDQCADGGAVLCSRDEVPAPAFSIFICTCQARADQWTR